MLDIFLGVLAAYFGFALLIAVVTVLVVGVVVWYVFTGK